MKEPTEEMIERKITETKANEIPMPKYQCHKQVFAAKILNISPIVLHEKIYPDSIMIFENLRIKPIIVSDKYICKHNPQVGGYYVRYEDGYDSYSPADVFESGYTIIADTRTN